MMYFTKNIVDCTGCTACMVVCTKNCISMKPDKRGFLYPEADLNTCIRCGRCEATCPIQHPRYVEPDDGSYKPKKELTEFTNMIQHAVAAITKNNETWENSASGGAFREVCNTVNKIAGTNGGYVWVYGAAFDGLVVKHCGHKMPEIQDFSKSKYIQSEMQNCFSEIRNHLKNREKVVFSGTPCQVAGLRAYLGKNIEDLFCIDFICHGVGSPFVFKRYLEEIGKNDKVKSYTFRAKVKKYGNYQRHLSEITKTSGKTEYVLYDDYNKLFLNQLCLRSCCGENCQYRDIHRQGDITLADFNNFTRLYPNKRDDRGYSTIVFNTEKGEEVFRRLSDFMEILPADMEDIKSYNPLLVKSTPENSMSASFYADFENGMNIEDLCEKYVQNSNESFTSILKRHIPYSVKYPLFRVILKMRGRK